MKNNFRNKINLSIYFEKYLIRDLASAVTVALVAIPQAMAYASIAGVNPVYGLYTAIIPIIFAAIFGDNKFLVTGPTNPMALMVASVLVGVSNHPNYAQYVFMLAIISGSFLLIAGILRLGIITRYISNSVMVGFIPAIGILIVSGQLGNLLGISLERGEGIIGLLIGLFSNLGEINIYVAIIGFITILIMLVVHRIHKKIPAALVAVLITTLLVQVTGWDTAGVTLISDIGFPESIKLKFSIPMIQAREFFSLLGAGFTIAFFVIVETISISKAISQQTGHQLDPSRELIGQGLASITGGFFQSIPSSGSPSRTSINIASGAKTRMSPVFSGLILLLIVSVFSRWMKLIPVSVLSGVVIVAAAKLINLEQILNIWNFQIESRLIMIATFTTAMLFPINYAIYIGVLLSILIYLNESSQNNLTYLHLTNDGSVNEFSLKKIIEEKPSIAIINVEGDLYFGAVNDFEERVIEMLYSEVKVVILRLRRMHSLGSTGILALEKVIQYAKKKNTDVLICGLMPEVEDLINESVLTDLIGSENIFVGNSRLFQSTKLAFSKATEILANK